MRLATVAAGPGAVAPDLCRRVGDRVCVHVCVCVWVYGMRVWVCTCLCGAAVRSAAVRKDSERQLNPRFSPSSMGLRPRVTIPQLPPLR